MSNFFSQWCWPRVVPGVDISAFGDANADAAANGLDDGDVRVIVITAPHVGVGVAIAVAFVPAGNRATVIASPEVFTVVCLSC